LTQAWKKASSSLPHFHGKCAEVLNISTWLKEIDPLGKFTIDQARKAFEGAIMHARKIRSDINTHATYKKACQSCVPLLEHFNITEVKLTTKI
jgi:hypothetical protein